MTLSRTRLALALAALFCASAPALASDCVYGTASGNKSQCYPTYAPIDPATGLPPAAGNSGGTSSVVKQGAKDSTAAPWDVNNAQIAGTPLSVGAGTTDAGTQRTQANQGAAGTTPWPVTESAANLGTTQATATTTSGQLCAARAGRRAITLTNLGTTDVWYGASGVTTGTGGLLLGTKGSAVTLNTAAAIFGVVAAGSQAVACIETY